VSQTVYNRLAVLRVEKGISRKELAAVLGVNPQTVGYLERGDFNPSLELALKLATYFDLPVEEIFSLTAFESLSQLVRRNKTNGGPS
jgi:DNA-binding XRE family transcriptional regulator